VVLIYVIFICSLKMPVVYEGPHPTKYLIQMTLPLRNVWREFVGRVYTFYNKWVPTHSLLLGTLRNISSKLS